MTYADLIKDIQITFPAIKAQLRESCIGECKVWMIGAEQSAVMPDGLSIFGGGWDDIEAGTHDGGIHTGFAAWLENRGFYLENEDGFWHTPCPLPTEQELMEWATQAARKAPIPVFQHGDPCPF